MKLATYMKNNGIDDDAMASIIGDCSASGVRKWKYGERIPERSTMQRIFEATNGEVAPNDFYDVGASSQADEGAAAAPPEEAA